MATIKHTKNELKAQRDALNRFERFLPTLQLKKQQLQVELLAVDARRAETLAAERTLLDRLHPWASLLSEDLAWETLVRVRSTVIEEGNIAGVSIPVLRSLDFERQPIDPFATPPWVDEAADTLEKLTRLRIERKVFDEQRRRIHEELQVTSQRVNLFERVKIPECRENIRIIRIFLGDEQTAAVVRGKFAKRRTQELAAEGAAGEPS